MKIVRSQTDGWYVLQESLDTQSTVDYERSEDENGHVMLLPEIEFDYDLPVQAEDPILLEMDEFLANANDGGNSQEGGTLRHDDYYPDSNLFSLFNESDFISDNDQSERVKSPLYSTTNRSTFDGEQLVQLMTNFGTSQTVSDKVWPEPIREDQLVENSSSDSDSSNSESSSSESSSSDSPSSESESDSDSSDSSVEPSLSDSSSNVVVQKLTTRQRKRLVETAEQREERCRIRRERERQQRAAMTPEELAKFREKKRASNRASDLKMRLKKAAELQKGLGLKDSRLKDSGLKGSGPKDSGLKGSGTKDSAIKGSGLKDSEPKRKRPVAQIPAAKLEKKQQVVQQNKNRKKSCTQMSIKELEKRRSAQRNQRRSRLARMTEQERQKHRERIREYDRLWREKKKAQYSRKNASSSKLPQNDELPPQKKNQKQPHNGATVVDLFKAQRERKNAQARMRRRAALASETAEQREERLRKRREQKRNRKEIPQVGEARPDQPEVENHFRQMASMITSKQLTEHRDRKRKRRNGGGNDPDYRPKLRGLPKRQRRQRPSIVDYSDSDD